MKVFSENDLTLRILVKLRKHFQDGLNANGVKNEKNYESFDDRMNGVQSQLESERAV